VKKEGHKRPDEYETDTIGEAWTREALERRTKLVLAFAVGRRALEKAFELTLKLRRPPNPNVRFHLTANGCNLTELPWMRCFRIAAISRSSPSLLHARDERNPLLEWW
jgi:hypothetical protein